MEKKVIKLDEIEKQNPFKVPENYFTDFNREIMNKLPEKEIVPPQKVTMWQKTKPWIYMAAMFIGFYLIINFLVQQPPKENNTTASAQLTSANDEYWSQIQVTEDELLQYIENQIINNGYYDFMYHQTNLN